MSAGSSICSAFPPSFRYPLQHAMTMPGPPASAGISFAGPTQSRNQRKKAAEGKRMWEAFQASQNPPQEWWTATCAFCKGPYDRLQHCACYAQQPQQFPNKGPQFYVSPPGPGRRRTLAMLATDPTNMMRTTVQLVSIRGGLLQEDARGLPVKLTSKQKNQHWTGLKR